MKTLRPGKTVDVNKLIELVKVETNDVLMVKQSCTVFTCYNNIGVNVCNFVCLHQPLKCSRTKGIRIQRMLW